MEGLLPILLFIAFAIASVLEKAGKKPGGPDRGTRPRPGQRPAARPRPRIPTPPPGPLPPASGRADEMVPEDFWRELTGQARPSRAPAPRPDPADLPSWDEDAIAQLEAGEDEESGRPEARSLEDYRREIVVREPAPVVVSLETPPLPPERRHAAFHARREVPAAPAPGAVPTPLQGSLLARLRRPQGARDAFVASEIFGRPKGLE